MPTTWNAIYLGNSPKFMDPYEKDYDAENADSFTGNSYGSSGDPLSSHVIEVEAIDNGGYRGVLDQNNCKANDELRYDLGDGPRTTTFDAVAEYAATITYDDGSTASVTAIVFQDDTGNLFLAPETRDNADTEAYEAKPIQSLTLDKLTGDTWAGLSQSRHATEFICFAGGTLIDTPHGPTPIEALREGDHVLTLDHGAEPIIWAGQRRVRTEGGGRAYRIRAGALGAAQPSRDLLVSAQHRIMLRSKIAGRMGDGAEVLVPVNKLAGQPGIAVASDVKAVVYHHILCPRHEIVMAEGAPCETLLPGPQAWSMLEAKARLDITVRLPGWRNMRPARPILDGARCRTLMARHLKNPQPLLMRA